ncbi:hypothetical protein E3V36_04700 [Candidatus Marinimicrobia bacterium MT.SAG.2]|nr:hypothetical protein E3V36_04700 [Candidatus Marinimicrobia bacterium MT.SAG.2]
MIFRFFVYGIVIVILSDIPNNFGIAYYGAYAIIGFLMLSICILPFRTALILLLMLAIAGKDIVSFGDLADAQLLYSTSSIWQMRLGPIRPSWFVFTVILCQFFKARKITLPPFINRAILWFATVPVITGLIYGGFFGDYASIEVVRDLKFPLMLLMSTILFLSLYRTDPRNLTLVLSVFVGVLLARHFIDLLYFVANFGPAIAEGVNRVSEDSAKGGVVFLIFFGVILIWVRKRVLLGSAITILSILLLATYGTRMLWLTFLLGGIVLLSILGIRRSVFFVSMMGLLTTVSIWTLFITKPESLEVITARSITITQGRDVSKFDVGVNPNIISRIDPVRFAEGLNIIDSVKRRNAYMWGMGYGGFYDDIALKFPLILIKASAFPDYSFETGKFYSAHFFPLVIYLKYGLLGLVLIPALWIIPGSNIFRKLRNRNIFSKGKPMLLNGMMLCMVAFLVTAMFQLYWSGKGLFINGMIIASCVEFTKQYQNLHKIKVLEND